VTKAQFEAAWGGCWTESGREVLVALPYSAEMLCELRRVMFTQLKAMECANPGFNLRLALYDKPYTNDMNAAHTKKSVRESAFFAAFFFLFVKADHLLSQALDKHSDVCCRAAACWRRCATRCWRSTLPLNTSLSSGWTRMSCSTRLTWSRSCTLLTRAACRRRWF
jgi:hypothetical protein